MLTDAITEIIDTLTELKRMHQLNLELLEQLNIACGWLLENKIQIPNQTQLRSILIKAQTLLEEIYSGLPPFLQHSANFKPPKLPPRKFRKRSPEDLPEPAMVKLK